MDKASTMQNIDLNEDLIDADMENVQGVMSDEDMVVAACYVAECYTFGIEPNLQNMDVQVQRMHVLDVIMSFLSFE